MLRQSVFLSYVSGDRLGAERLRSALLGAGLTIASDIQTADRFLACFGSGWNEPEVEAALDHIRHLPRSTVWFLPVKLTACELPSVRNENGETLIDFPAIDLPREALDRFAQLVAALPSATSMSQQIPIGRVTGNFGTLRVGGHVEMSTDGTPGEVAVNAEQTTIDKDLHAGTKRRHES